MGRPRVKTSEAPQAAGAGLAGVGVSLPRTPGHTHAIEGPRGHAQAQPAQGQGLSTPRILGGTIARSPRALDATAKIAAWGPAPWDYAEGNLNKDKTITPRQPCTALFSRSKANFYASRFSAHASVDEDGLPSGPRGHLFRRTDLNDGRSNPCRDYPGPGAYLSMALPVASSTIRNAKVATMDRAGVRDKCTFVPSRAHALPALPGQPGGGVVHEFLPLVGREITPCVGMLVTVSRRQMRRWHMPEADKMFVQYSGIIFEVAESGLSCMVEWREPFPADEGQYSLCHIGRIGQNGCPEFWLAQLPGPKREPIQKQWAMDAVVSPRYTYNSRLGTYSMPSKKTYEQARRERIHPPKGPARGSIIAEIKHKVLIDNRMLEAQAEERTRRNAFLSRLQGEMEKRNLGGKLRTIADVKPQRAPNPLDMLMTASGLRAIAQDPQFDDDRDIIQKIVAEGRDLFESQLRLVHTQGVYHQVTCDQKAEKRETTEETTRQWEPLTEDELKLLGRLHGVRRLLKRTETIKMRLKAEKAKKILRQKSQKQLALPDVPEHLDLSIKEASSLKKIGDAKVIPSISSSKMGLVSMFNHKSMERQIRHQSRSVLVTDEGNRGIYRPASKAQESKNEVLWVWKNGQRTQRPADQQIIERLCKPKQTFSDLQPGATERRHAERNILTGPSGRLRPKHETRMHAVKCKTEQVKAQDEPQGHTDQYNHLIFSDDYDDTFDEEDMTYEDDMNEPTKEISAERNIAQAEIVLEQNSEAEFGVVCGERQAASSADRILVRSAVEMVDEETEVGGNVDGEQTISAEDTTAVASLDVPAIASHDLSAVVMVKNQNAAQESQTFPFKVPSEGVHAGIDEAGTHIDSAERDVNHGAPAQTLSEASRNAVVANEIEALRLNRAGNFDVPRLSAESARTARNGSAPRTEMSKHPSGIAWRRHETPASAGCST